MPKKSDTKTGKHILLVHQAFAALNEPGGTRHYEMAQFFIQSGHRVTVICSPISYLTGKTGSAKNRWLSREQPMPGLEILRAYTYPALHRSFFHRLLSFFSFMFSSFWIGLGVKNVDVVWGTSPPIFQGVTAWLLARLKGVKFVFEIRDLWPEFAIAMKVIRNPVIIFLSTRLESFLYRHADHLVVNSPGFIAPITAKGGHNITLIPNGVDPEMFDPWASGEAFREQFGLQGKFIVLYAGAHGVSNDLEVILQAANLTRSQPEISFVFVGDGKEKPKLQQIARDLALPNVLFVPSVPKEGMKEILAAADCCVAILKPIDQYKTTYPNKVFDYMAAGRPVLCAIDGVIREVVEKANGGFFVPPGNPQAMAEAVFKLKRMGEDARQLGTNARAYVIQYFDRRSIAAEMEKLLASESRS
jgi:glycosyltransferase involved in cell wall biosynthesis